MLKNDIIEIEVPDTFDLFLAVLAFMYTGDIATPKDMKGLVKGNSADNKIVKGKTPKGMLMILLTYLGF